MICAFPFCDADLKDLRLLLSWIKVLGGCKRHHAVLVADAGVEYQEALEMMSLAGESFSSTSIISNNAPVTGWPAGPNSLFFACARHMQDEKLGPWFWCETDCIPLKKDWLDGIQSAYGSAGKRFLGALVKDTRPETKMPLVHLAGCAIYPPDAFSVIGHACNGNLAWDMASADRVVPLAGNTPLVQSFWGQKDLPPTFRSQKFPGCAINTFTLDDLHADSVVFHRNKDGTLIRLLWQKISPLTLPITQEFITVVPFHNGDFPLALKSMNWQFEMQCPKRYDCLLAYDSKVIKQYIQQMQISAQRVFRTVDTFTYPAPPTNRWPQAANHAFAAVARFMCHALKRPWFWMEPDLIPLCSDWLCQLQFEYDNCKKPMMGSIVPELGHVNGTAVYPANFAELAPKTIAAQTGAFDTNMKAETISFTHNAGHLMQHAWGVSGGQIHHILGPAPSFKTVADVKRWVSPGAVTFHRCKDGSLINKLRELRRKP